MAIPITILIFLFVFLMLFGSNMVIVGLRRLSRETHSGVFTMSAILLALATSFPELSVAITSGLAGRSELSYGNVIGANIANLTLVAGGAALIAGRVIARGSLIPREVFLAGAAGVIPLILLFDGALSRLDGLILVALWGAYVLHFFRIRFVQIAREFREEGFWYRFLHRVNANHIAGRETARLLIGVALLLFSADIVVRLAGVLAKDAGMPIFLVGVFVLALGTTLPELIFSFRSLLSREPSMFLGNILGSIIINSTLIVGIASFLSPIEIESSKVIFPALTFILTYLLFWFFVRTKHRLDRWEAGVLLGVYIIFVLLVLAR